MDKGKIITAIFSNRYEFTYSITETKIRIVKEDEDNNDGYYITNLVYMISNNGKSLLLNGWDDNDMEELYFTKQ